MNIMSSDKQRYLRRVSKAIGKYDGSNNQLLDSLSSAIDNEYSDNTNRIKIKQLYREFGSPDEIASQLADQDQLIVANKSKKTLKKLFIVLAILILVSVIVHCAITVYIRLHRNLHITETDGHLIVSPV